MHAAAYMFLPLSWIYGAAVAIRNRAFEGGVLVRWKAPVPVISVGNMTTGGTGKTPLVEYLTGWCLERGVRCAVVSRGYGRTTKGVVVVSDGSSVLSDPRLCGDEPLQIALRYPRAIVVVAERRVRAARLAIEELGARVVIMDDGFQHRYLQRDMDIVVVDAEQELVAEPLLPAGRRREPMTGLRRAHMVAFSRCNGVMEQQRLIPGKFFSGTTIAYQYRIPEFMEMPDTIPVSLETLQHAPVFVFTGIGNHQGFVRDVTAAGITVAGAQAFGDHHWYTTGDLAEIAGRARALAVSTVLTTRKDAVRLTTHGHALTRSLDGLRCVATIASVTMTAGEAVLDRWLGDLLREHS